MIYTYLQERNQEGNQDLITDEERLSDATRVHITSEQQQREGESIVGADEGNANDNMASML